MFSTHHFIFFICCLLHNLLYVQCNKDVYFQNIGKYQVKDMEVYIEPITDKILKLWVGPTMYDISKPTRQKQFQFHGILTRTIHDALGLTHFNGM